MPIRDVTGRVVRHPDQMKRIALAHTRETNPRYRLALIVILMHDNPRGETFPSLRTIARYVGCTRTTAWRAIQHLADLGEVQMIRGRGGGADGARIANRYAVSIACPDGCPDPDHRVEETYPGKLPY